MRNVIKAIPFQNWLYFSICIGQNLEAIHPQCDADIKLITNSTATFFRILLVYRSFLFKGKMHQWYLDVTDKVGLSIVKFSIHLYIRNTHILYILTNLYMNSHLESAVRGFVWLPKPISKYLIRSIWVNRGAPSGPLFISQVETKCKDHILLWRTRHVFALYG